MCSGFFVIFQGTTLKPSPEKYVFKLTNQSDVHFINTYLTYWYLLLSHDTMSYMLMFRVIICVIGY